MKIIHNKNDLPKIENLAFVPTMGNLHDGHLSLIKTAKKYSQNVIVSIFVNPAQFAPNEDFATYPRTLNEDISLLQTVLTENDILYIPTIEDIYPYPSKIWFDIPHLTNCLCGKSRPHFFNGVITVLLKFILQISPTFLILGEKDYQQFLVTSEMVKSIGFQTKVIPSPIIRNQNGLALSSRNTYLKNLTQAELINKILFEEVWNIKNSKKTDLLYSQTKLSSFCEIDYLEIRHNQTLELFAEGKNVEDFRLFFAGRFENVRLIDNIPLIQL